MFRILDDSEDMKRAKDGELMTSEGDFYAKY